MHPGFTIGAVYLCREPVDFRRQINGLSAMVEGELALNAFEGNALFIFINRHHDRLKILYWDRNGFCLWHKRLEQGHFAWPGAGASRSVCELTERELEWLLAGFDPWALNAHKSLNYQYVA